MFAAPAIIGYCALYSIIGLNLIRVGHLNLEYVLNKDSTLNYIVSSIEPSRSYSDLYR